MIATAHLLVSCVLASKIDKQEISSSKKASTALAVGTLTHLGMDALPHFDPSIIGSAALTIFTTTWYFAVLDNLIGFSLVAYWWFLEKHRIPKWLIAISVLGCWGPDLYIVTYKSGHIPSYHLFATLTIIHTYCHNWWILLFNLSVVQVTWIKLALGVPLTIIALRMTYRKLREISDPREHKFWVKPKLSID